MKDILKAVLYAVMLLLGGAILGTIFLCLAYCVPVNENNKAASYAILEQEGMYPALPIVNRSEAQYFHSFQPGVIDSGSDEIMLRTSLDPEEKNVVRAAMDMNHYNYYWHGYVMILRPLLVFFDYGELRVLNFCGQLLLLFLTTGLLWKKRKVLYVFLILSAYFLLMPLALAFSFQFACAYYIAFGAALFLLRKDRYEQIGEMQLGRLFLIAGMLTSFFDLLSYPLYTWGFPMLFWLMLQKEDKKAFEYLKSVVQNGLWWILGYGGFWLLKGVFGSILLGENIFREAFYEVSFRLGTSQTDVYDLAERFGAIYKNWKHYEYKLYVLLFILWALYFCVRLLRYGVRRNVKSSATALVGLSAPVWYFTLSNQTAGHHFFTYRIFGIAVLAVILIMAECSGVREEKKERNLQQKAVLISAMIFALAGGFGLANLAREDLYVTNGQLESEYHLLEDGENTCMDFAPSFSKVIAMDLCLYTEASQGVCKIAVLDAGKLLYEEEIALERYRGIPYAGINVDWKLKGGKKYELRISTENADDEVYLMTSTGQELPLAELGPVSLGDESFGQIIGALKYSCRPLSRFTMFFLTLSWAGVLGSAGMVLFSVMHKNAKKLKKGIDIPGGQR